MALASPVPSGSFVPAAMNQTSQPLSLSIPPNMSAGGSWQPPLTNATRGSPSSLPGMARNNSCHLQQFPFGQTKPWQVQSQSSFAPASTFGTTGFSGDYGASGLASSTANTTFPKPAPPRQSQLQPQRQKHFNFYPTGPSVMDALMDYAVHEPSAPVAASSERSSHTAQDRPVGLSTSIEMSPPTPRCWRQRRASAPCENAYKGHHEELHPPLHPPMAPPSIHEEHNYSPQNSLPVPTERHMYDGDRMGHLHAEHDLPVGNGNDQLPPPPPRQEEDATRPPQVSTHRNPPGASACNPPSNLEKHMQELLEGQQALKRELAQAKAEASASYMELEAMRQEAQRRSVEQVKPQVTQVQTNHDDQPPDLPCQNDVLVPEPPTPLNIPPQQSQNQRSVMQAPAPCQHSPMSPMALGSFVPRRGSPERRHNFPANMGYDANIEAFNTMASTMASHAAKIMPSRQPKQALPGGPSCGTNIFW